MRYRVYERSLCQSYASAYRRGIVLAECDGRDEAVRVVEDATCDSYRCFALAEDGTVFDLTRELPGHLSDALAS